VLFSKGGATARLLSSNVTLSAEGWSKTERLRLKFREFGSHIDRPLNESYRSTLLVSSHTEGWGSGCSGGAGGRGGLPAGADAGAPRAGHSASEHQSRGGSRRGRCVCVGPVWRSAASWVPLRAVGKLCVVPAGALPVPVSEIAIEPCI
jgi:hypothetical protein